MKSFAIELLPAQFDLWNRFVDDSPQGDVFCYSWWLDAITKGNFKILAVFENDEIVAGIPLAYYLGKINEPPITRTLGPLFKDLSRLSEHDRSTLERQWLELLLDEIPYDDFEQFCTSHNFIDWLPFRWRGYKQMTRYTYLIDFEGKTEKELWNQLNSNRKRNIRKALSHNLISLVTDDLRAFYSLVELTYKRQGLTFRFSYDDFKLLDDEIVKRDQRRIITVFDNVGTPHAAIYLVFNPKSAYALLSASDPTYGHLGGHSLANWEAIRYFSSRVRYYNFGGSDIQRIETHLRSYGGTMAQYFHIFADRSVVTEVEKVVEKEVIREIVHSPPPPPDDWRYHVGLIMRHSWLLIKKALYKVHIRFSLPVRVTVVVPCFNHGKYILENLQSIFNQTFQFYEIIIVDDGSTDETATVLKKIRHKKVRIFYTANHGPANARNLAITHAKGDLIVNLDADDRIAPEFLHKCVEVMDTNPNVGIVYSNAFLFGHKYEPFRIHDYTFEGMLRANCIIANACYRRCDWEKTEGYSSFLQHGYEDFDFWLSILELGREVRKIEETLVFIRTYQHPVDSRSGRRLMNIQLHDLASLQAFRRHRQLYQKSHAVYAGFLEMETRMASILNEPPGFNPNPVFSIITPTNNRPGFLRRNIESVQKQSFTNWEQIIVDDANSLETRTMVESFNDPRIKYLVHENSKGAAGAYNTGMKNASGKYLNFLDDDDEYLPDILMKIRQTFDEANNNPGFVWTGITRVKDTATGEEIIRTQLWPADFETLEQGLMVSTAIGNGFGLSVKRECLKKTGFYDETLRVGEDTDFMLRLSKYYNFRTVPEVLVKIHHHGDGQLTHEKFSRLKMVNYGKIIDRNRGFLKNHWDAYYMHHKVYVNLCYQLKDKKAGMIALWKLVKTFPNRRIAWLDLFSYIIAGKDYNSVKLKTWVKAAKQALLPVPDKTGQPAESIKELPKTDEESPLAKSIREMDLFRENYDLMTFGQLVDIANDSLHKYPEQAHYTLPFVFQWIENHVPRPARVLEIGGWRGDLARDILSRYGFVEEWDNFDVISDQSTQKCKDNRYRQIPLSDYIWNLDLSEKYNALIATHMIEHLKWRELLLLMRWIPAKIQTVLFEAPVVQSADNFDWTGNHSTHILEKGWKQIVEEMDKNGFVKIFAEKDTVIFKRKIDNQLTRND